MTTLFTVNYSGGYGYLYEFMAQATEETYSIADNTSRVTVNTFLRRTNVSSAGAYNLNGTAWNITIDGTPYSGTSTWDTRNTSDWQIIGSATKVVTHNADGKKTITISASHTGNSASSSSKMGNASGSSSFILTNIPRTSSITATDANIESATSININRASSSFTHTITYSFSGLTGTIVSKTSSTSVGWTVPSTFYAKIPNSKTGTVTLTCTTYSGDTVVGTSTTTFIATASEEKCKPTITATLIDSNSRTVALTGSNAKLIKYKSTAKITPTATTQNSATIKSITVNNTAVDGSYIEFTNVQNETFKVIATDSRGYTNETTLSPAIVQYILLTLNAEFYRTAATSSEVKVKYSGNYFNASFGSVTNTLTVTWQYRKKGVTTWSNGGTLAPTISGNTYSGEISLGKSYDYKEAYEFIIYASDKLTSLNVQQPLKKGEPIYDYGVDKNGVNYLNVNGKIYESGVDILNLIYPVGAIYISTNSTSPATLFGGTWTQIKDTFLLAAGSTYSAGTTGGAATVKLETTHLPSHSHTGTTNTDGTHVHDSTAYGWMIDGVGNARSEISTGSSGFGSDIRIRNNNSQHSHSFTTNSTGGNTAHNNMPPYLAVYVWKRTA